MSPVQSAPRPSPARRPVQHRPAGEVPAAANERHAVGEQQGVAVPELDGGVGPHDPLPVGSVQMNGNAAERTAPFHHGGVIMRVRDCDSGEPAERLDDRDRRGIDEGDAVPQYVAGGRAHEQRALADGEFGNRPDADQAGLMLLIAVEMPAPEALERGPPLAAGRNELPLVLADRAARRRLVRRRELAAAGLADEGGHQATLAFSAGVETIRRHSGAPRMRRARNS